MGDGWKDKVSQEELNMKNVHLGLEDIDEIYSVVMICKSF